MKRTVRDFACAGDLWPTVDAWAAQHRYRVTESEGDRRIYQRGIGFLTAPMMVLVEPRPSGAHLEAWVRGTLLARLFSFFILPAEMSVESGGFKGVVPRNMMRKDVNALLASFGQPAIG